MCSEARQKIWSHAPDTVFIVDGKELKFVQKTSSSKRKRKKSSFNKENDGLDITLTKQSNSIQHNFQVGHLHSSKIQNWPQSNSNQYLSYSNNTSQNCINQNFNSGFYPVQPISSNQMALNFTTPTNFLQYNNASDPYNSSQHVNHLGQFNNNSQQSNNNQNNINTSTQLFPSIPIHGGTGSNNASKPTYVISSSSNEVDDDETQDSNSL